jgi:glyoxylase-like metal-dependent hydrolase (beta-lactamase superfamily II)
MSKNAKFEEIFGVVYDNGQVRVEQLIVGYYDTELGKACGSVSLISVKDYNILVDCGLPSTDLKIDSNDVNCVIVTHWHSDHCGRLCDFHKAHRILPDNNVNELDFSQIKKYGIDESNYYLELLKLDGHSLVDLALVIQPSLKTDELIVIAGLFLYISCLSLKIVEFR